MWKDRNRNAQKGKKQIKASGNRRTRVRELFFS
jgi:hypothetical protein